MDMLAYKENEIMKSAIRKQALEQFKVQEAKQEVALRSNIIKDYYKKTLENIMDFIKPAGIKIMDYTTVDPATDIFFDKWAKDNNRMMDDKTLESTIKKDVQWFLTVNHSEQEELLMNLLRISGGYVIKRLLLPFMKIYHSRRKKELKLARSSNVLNRLRSKVSITPEVIVNYEDEEEFLQTHPDSVKVQKQRKRWDDLINNYKSQVEKTSVEANKIQEVQKGSKKKDIKNEGVVEVLDWIQLLPVPIIKKICSFLDLKSRKSLQSVNKYYQYVCAEVFKEEKVRKKLDETLTKLVCHIDPIKLSDFNAKLEGSPCALIPNMPGSINDDLILVKGKKGETSLVVEAMRNISKGEGRPTHSIGEVSVFPRIIPSDVSATYRKPCPFNDVEILMDVKNDIGSQKSNLTYSLTSKSSIDISLHIADLADW